MVWLGSSCYYCELYDEAQSYLTESLHILKEEKADQYVGLSAQSQSYLGRVLSLKELYEDALSSFDSALQLYRKSGNNSKEIATIHFYKGKVLAKQKGSLNKAIDEFKRCLAIRKEQREGVESEAIAEVLIEVGDVLFDQRKYTSALNCYNEGLRIRKTKQGPELLIASASHKVGNVYLKQRQFTEAMHAFEVAQNVYANTDEFTDEKCFLTLNIGLVHKQCMRQEEALESFLSALDVLRKNVLSDKECMAACTFQIGALLSIKKDYLQAGNYLLEALELRRDLADSSMIGIAEVLKELGDVHLYTGSFENAKAMYLEASEIYKDNGRHSDLISCLSQLGSLYLKNDELDKSLQFYESAWSLCKDHDLNNEHEASSILYGLGFIYNQMSRYQEAMEMLKISLKIRLKILGKQNLEVATTCEQLGTALVSLSRYEDALKVCTTSLEIYQKELGENHISCARVMLDIGTIYCHKQNYDLSLVQLQACLQFFKVECGDTSEEVANVLLRIGQIHDLRVDHDEAMKCMNEALDIRIKLHGNNHFKVAETVLNIARVLEDWGDIDEVSM